MTGGATPGGDSFQAKKMDPEGVSYRCRNAESRKKGRMLFWGMRTAIQGATNCLRVGIRFSVGGKKRES